MDTKKYNQIVWLLGFEALILLAIPSAITIFFSIAFLLYAAFIFQVLWKPLHEKTRRFEGDNHKFFTTLGIFSLLFILYTRLVPFLRWGEAPLGYDTGGYLQYFNLIMDLGRTVGSVGSPIAYALWFPFYFLGVPGLATIQILHIFHQFLTVGALYFFLRSLYPGENSRARITMTIFLFAISVNQFMGYWWMFYKQSAAIPFLLLAMGLWFRGSWTAIIFATLAAMIHLPISAPFFAAVVLVYSAHGIQHLWNRRRIRFRQLITVSGVIIAILIIVALMKNDIKGAVQQLIALKGLAINAPAWAKQQFKGLFISFSVSLMNSIFYLPFSILGLAAILRSWWQAHPKDTRQSFLITFSALLLVLVSFPVIYQNRFLVLLDLVAIIVAIYPVTLFTQYLLAERNGSIVIALLCVGAFLFSSLIIWNNQPQLYPDEREELKYITQIRKENDYAMASDAIYTPWVYMYTNFQPTIAPGWLYWQKWDLPMWQEFWRGESDDRRNALLQLYGANSIYIFVGRRQVVNPNLQKFLDTDPRIIRISPHIWRYSSSQTP